MIKNIISEVKSVDEASIKWEFEKKNSNFSGAPTIFAIVNDLEFTIGYNGIDEEWFINVTSDDPLFSGKEKDNIFQDLFGEQGDFSSLEANGSKKDLFTALKKKFGVEVESKALYPIYDLI